MIIHSQLLEANGAHCAFVSEDCSDASNIERFAKDLGINTGRVTYCRQTHSDHIAVINEMNLGREIDDCDAMVCVLPDTPLLIRTADCVPVAIYDREHKIVACVHAGRIGTEKEISAKCIRLMTEMYHSSPNEIFCCIGPAICGDCYEVPYEMALPFPAVCHKKRSERDLPLLDLKLANKLQLLSLGIPADNIEDVNICTMESDVWPSYRRDKTKERMGTIVNDCMGVNGDYTLKKFTLPSSRVSISSSSPTTTLSSLSKII